MDNQPTQGVLVVGSVITDDMISALAAHFIIHQWETICDTHAHFTRHGASIRYALTTGHDGIPVEIADLLPSLKVISCFGVGYDGVDVDGAIANDIIVTHTPEVLNDDVANTAIMLLLATMRDLINDDQYVRTGMWAKHGPRPLTHSIRDKRVGILGLGRIGKALADKLQVFGCTVVYHSRCQRQDVDWQYYADLAKMAKDCDVLILTTPGDASTHHIINASIIKALGPNGVLINVARGSVVDEVALAQALKAKQLGSAGLDVFANEPNPHPDLLDLPNVVLTPHVASATFETRHAMGALAVNNLIEHSKNGQTISPIPECTKL